MGTSETRLVIALGLATICGGCATAPMVVAPQSGTAAAHADALDTDAQSKAAAAAQAAQRANTENAPGAARESTAGELGVVVANLPSPSAEDLAAALARVEIGLRGDLAEARKQWTQAQGEAAQLRQQLATADAAAVKERADSAAKIERMIAQHKAELDRVQREAEERQQRILGLMFYGGGGLFILLGIGCLTVFSSLPIAGPKVAASLIASGFASIAAGRAVQWMLDHTWAIVAAIVLPLVAAVALAVANHYHSVNAAPAK